MKRTLLEILSALSVLVLLASFHHQITRLKMNHGEVAELREKVDLAVKDTTSRREVIELRTKLLQTMEARLHSMEQRLADATVHRHGDALRTEVERARQETALFKAELDRDLKQTRRLVDSYHQRAEASLATTQKTLAETKTELSQVIRRYAPNATVLTETMLAPAVQLNGDDTVGSGTLVYSAVNPATKQIENYVLTAYHVVRNILADTPKARTDGLAVTLYQGQREEVRGDLIAHKAEIDTAVIRLRSTKIYPHVAAILGETDERAVQVWDPVYAVGCPLGNDPIPTQGEISSMRNELSGANYWMINAPTYFGNSGGAIYLTHSRALLGVFSKIYTHGRGTPVVIPHMGLLTPMPLIRKWLRQEGKEFILNMPKPGGQDAHLMAPAPR